VWHFKHVSGDTCERPTKAAFYRCTCRKNRAITCGGYGTHADAELSKSQHHQHGVLLRRSAGSGKCALAAECIHKGYLRLCLMVIKYMVSHT